jgi:hypothetical protein
MKSANLILLAAIVTLAGWRADAQTNEPTNALVRTTPPAQSKTILETNWVAPGEYLRVVDGKLYNTYYSKLWVHPAFDHPPRANPLDNPWNAIGYSLQVEFIDTDKIICGVWRDEYKHETYTGQLGLDDSTHIKSIVIYHYPNPQSLITGQKIDPVCLKVSNCISNGISLEAYDCGVQSTNLVPLVRTVKIKLNQ